MPEYHTLAVTSYGPVGLIAFNRAEAANALNMQMALELKDYLSNLTHENTDVRALLMTGEGRHFCAGADLKERQGMDEAGWQSQHEAFEAALHALMDCPVPVLAAVNGAAFGGGLELALACDFIYASESAKFCMSEVTLGIMPGLGGTQHLPRAVGASRARELIFTGQVFNAHEALAWGMVNRICAPARLMEETLETAGRIAAHAPLSVRAVKKAINEGRDLSLAEALHCELAHYNTLINTHDRQEGISAFNEKRKPRFTGS